MSLAYKLWKIGSVLNEHDIRKALKDDAESKEGEEHNYVNINFIFENEEIKVIELNENSICKDKMFFTKKIGGSGTGIYYLYPNLNIQNEKLEKKIYQLINTVENSVVRFSNEINKKYGCLILKRFENIKKYIEIGEIELEKEKNERELNDLLHSDNNKLRDKKQKKIEKLVYNHNKKIEDFDECDPEFLSIIKTILTKSKDNYWFWFSINGKTFYELMPEIWDNWYKCPVIKNNDAKEGYDAFTNQEAEIGYKPEIKIFSYDNYHDSLNFRINDNLPLSFESARNVKFAWVYILENLVFYYKGLEYIIIPNLIPDDPEILKTILERFRRAKGNTSLRKTTLESLQDQERKLDKDIEKLGKKKNQKEDVQKLDELEKERIKISSEVEKNNIGMIQQIETEINEVGDLRNSITVDYFFVSINRTNLSFEIKGSIEDVVPSHVSHVVALMRREWCEVTDIVTLKKRDRGKTYLQDFFNREELYFALNRSSRNNANAILAERLFLAKLLLTNEKIKKEDLLRRFEINREFNYHNKIRLTKDGIKEWVNFSDSFIKDENNIMNFLNKLHKIKE